MRWQGQENEELQPLMVDTCDRFLALAVDAVTFEGQVCDRLCVSGQEEGEWVCVATSCSAICCHWCVRVCICIHTLLCIHVCMYVCIYACIHICKRVCVCVCVCVCVSEWVSEWVSERERERERERDESTYAVDRWHGGGALEKNGVGNEEPKLGFVSTTHRINAAQGHWANPCTSWITTAKGNDKESCSAQS